LIWRRQELENYFLIPEYLAKSPHLAATADELSATIRAASQRIVFRDIANSVIIRVRDDLKRTWVETMQSTTGLTSIEEVAAALKAMSEFDAQKRSVAQRLGAPAIERIFEQAVHAFLGDKTECVYGAGSWHERVRGKHALPEVIQTCFKVRAANGRTLRGDQAVIEVVKGLLRLPLHEQPDDFRLLHKLITDRVASK
jgi:hypothetical protein